MVLHHTVFHSIWVIFGHPAGHQLGQVYGPTDLFEHEPLPQCVKPILTVQAARGQNEGFDHPTSNAGIGPRHRGFLWAGRVGQGAGAGVSGKASVSGGGTGIIGSPTHEVGATTTGATHRLLASIDRRLGFRGRCRRHSRRRPIHGYLKNTTSKLRTLVPSIDFEIAESTFREPVPSFLGTK